MNTRQQDVVPCAAKQLTCDPFSLHVIVTAGGLFFVFFSKCEIITFPFKTKIDKFR